MWICGIRIYSLRAPELCRYAPPSRSALSKRLTRFNTRFVVGYEQITHIVPEPEVIYVFNIFQIPYMFPLALAGKLLFNVRWLSVQGRHYDALWGRGPPRTWRLPLLAHESIGSQRTAKGVAIAHIFLEIGPLHGLVGRGAAVDEEDGIEGKAPYERRYEDREESRSTHADIAVETHAPDGKVLVEIHFLGWPERPHRVHCLDFRL